MSAGPQWLGRVKDLVREAVDQLPDQGSRTRRLAEVSPDPERGPGWFVVHKRLSRADIESATDGRLRSAKDPTAPDQDVLEVVVAGERVRVRVSTTAPATVWELHVLAGQERRILSGLADALDAVSGNPLLATVGAKQLTPLPDGFPDSEPDWAGLRPAQQRAVAACCAPGIQVVWGPPATGKTHLIAAALRRLTEAGQRVLLISSTAVAVDDALLRMLRLTDPGPDDTRLQTLRLTDPGPGDTLPVGDALHEGDTRPVGGTLHEGDTVRVGAIHHSGLADDERVNLTRLTRQRQSGPIQRAKALQARIRLLTNADRRYRQAQEELADFDSIGYQRANQRVANRAARERQQQDLAPAEADMYDARRDQNRHRRLLLSLAWREATTRLDQTRAELTILESQYSELKRALWGGVRHRSALRELQDRRAEQNHLIAQAEVALAEAARNADAAGVTPQTCGDRERADLETGRELATGRLKAAETRLESLRRELARLNALELADPADQSLVSEQWPRWQVHNSLPKLQREAEQERRLRRPLELDYEALQLQITNHRRNVEQQIVDGASLVATTFTQIALHPWLFHESFDHVIVEDAATVTFPHLVHAIGRARIGAVLIGDHRQTGPVLDPDFPDGAQIGKLFTTECFPHFGVDDLVTAADRPGCVVLTEQFDVNSVVRELVNRSTYEQLLQPAAAEPAGEIVVLNVDRLPTTLRTIHHPLDPVTGWWAIGSLLGLALTEHHEGSSGSAVFAVATPHAMQAQATEAVVGELTGERALTPVGTSRALQGRRFTTVLADLVEDGTGWIAAARQNQDGYALAGLRHFSVVVTRATNRLYVLASQRALELASDGPLAALQQMVLSGRVPCVDLAEMLAIHGAAGTLESQPAADVMTALEPFVPDVRSESAAVEMIVNRIAQATTRIWCWNGWTGAFTEAVLEALDQAHRRGVEINLVTAPADQAPSGRQRSGDSLVAMLPRVVFKRDVHQKLIVVDTRWSIVGDSDDPRGRALPAPGRDQTGLLITVESPQFARQILAVERASELAKDRHCRQCGAELREYRDVGQAPRRRWVWLCPSHHQTPFPDYRQRNRRND